MIASMPKWFGVFDYPINSTTYEDIQDPELAECVAAELVDTTELFRQLRGDGWQVEVDWGADEATCQVTHPGYQTAASANARLRELGIKRFECFDVADLIDS